MIEITFKNNILNEGVFLSRLGDLFCCVVDNLSRLCMP